jgi:hypothetical protein
MRLKDRYHSFPTASLRGLKHGRNFARKMRVVVDIDDPVLFSSKFIPPSYTGEPAKRS